MSYSVGQVAELAGVTVRTLHHYDKIALLSPRERSTAGYRRYGDGDLERLQQIMFYRELGFSLVEIATLLDDPNADASAHLRRQRRLLSKRMACLGRMVTAIDKAMEAQKMNIALTPEERFEIFGDFTPEDYAEEVEERWGGTEAFAQSQRLVAEYTKQDWEQLKAEGAEIEHRLAAALRDDASSDSERAMELAERHRRHITRWFYDCGHDMHRGLGEMYANDPRFTAYYEDIAPGLAVYLRDAISANADRAAAD